MSRYLAIGSACWDEVPVGDERERRLGGSVLFAARVAQAAGWKVEVVTSGTAELEAAVRAELPDVEVTVQRSATDTVMAFGPDADLGPQRVPTVADPIEVAALGSRLEVATVVHLAPIMGEVTGDLLAAVRPHPFVGLTPQGLLRWRDPATGRLELLAAPTPWWAAGVDAVVLSEAEYDRIAEPVIVGGRAVAVTRGERGCFGWQGDAHVDLPGIRVELDAAARTIGAGDVFATALFLALAGGASFAAAMDRANRTAARHVAGRLGGADPDGASESVP